MKIVMLQDFFGLDQQYQENLLTIQYRKMGYEVTVISSTFENVFDYIKNNYDSNKTYSVLDYHGAKIIKLPYSINILNKLRKHKDVFKILEDESPDLIYSHDIHLNIREAVRYKKKYPKCKIIMDYHADYSNSAKNWISLNILHKIIRKSFLHYYLKNIDRIYPVVPASLDFLKDVYGIDSNKMEILPLGCDYSYCLDVLNSTNRLKTRETYNIKQEDTVIFSGGKLDPLKRIEIAIEAVRVINNVNLHLIIVGGASKENEHYEKELKDLAANNKNIHFFGMISSDMIYKLMAISDIALFPSSQSVLWQQSIGMNLPLIAGDSGGQDMEYLNLSNNVIKVESKDINVSFFTDIIIDLLKNSDKLQLMKKGSKKVAEEYLDYKIIAEKTLSVLS